MHSLRARLDACAAHVFVLLFSGAADVSSGDWHLAPCEPPVTLQELLRVWSRARRAPTQHLLLVADARGSGAWVRMLAALPPQESATLNVTMQASHGGGGGGTGSGRSGTVGVVQVEKPRSNEYFSFLLLEITVQVEKPKSNE